ncbi:acetate/propionate family kinase [Crateriforma conspicua]|uniref:Acetate kinase n=1 Tax=Crateriforma conspicua TaxID=2527996 RepID=A0A5C6FKC9_9PLAN|nr:acetate/propionate family kinase [Crateriforma conspicua]TWU61058.1 Acetate kinase [Crateriforma conspicua]
MNVLVVNVGSTTLKYACIDTQRRERLTEGLIDRIGQDGGDAPDHMTAVQDALQKHADIEFAAIGHRVVQGGDRFTEPTRVTDQVRSDMVELDPLAPLHNPPARRVIDHIATTSSSIPQVLVFDTAYFSTLPPVAYRYAVPDSVYVDHGVRKYGMHGTSHQYVTGLALDHLAAQGIDRASAKVITLHLGGGASATASIGGRAVDTSMGLTPLEGLVMATRCGDIDPSVPIYLMRTAGWTVDQVERVLIKESGLLGLCGQADMRLALEAATDDDESAKLAIDIYVRRLHKYVGSYFAVLGGLDALVFTAGIGENSAEIRRRVVEPLHHLGLRMDLPVNAWAKPDVQPIDLSSDDATVRTLVVPTDEEWAIARQTADVIDGR